MGVAVGVINEEVGVTWVEVHVTGVDTVGE